MEIEREKLRRCWELRKLLATFKKIQSIILLNVITIAYVANVDDLIHIDVDEEEELEQTPMDSERTLSVIPGGGEVSAQKETEERVADSGDASQEKDAAVDPSVQILPSIAENIISPADPVSALAAVPLRTVSQKSKKRHRPTSSETSASDSSFGFEDMSADDFADTCYHFGKALHKKTSSMAKDISDLQQKVRRLDEANAKVASLKSSEAVARQEVDRLKADLAKAEGLLLTQEEQLKFKDEQLRKMREENHQHLAVAKKMKADFEENIRQMEETPAQNVVQKVISGYKAAPETLEEIQVILAPALRRGYTLGVDEAKPADLVISTLPNHKLYDKKAGEVFTKRYEYKSGEDIVRKYAKRKPSQPSVQPSTITSAQPSETSVQTSAPPAS